MINPQTKLSELSEIGWKPGIISALTQAGIRTLEDLQRFRPEDLWVMPRISRVTVRRIQGYLEQLCLQTGRIFELKPTSEKVTNERELRVVKRITRVTTTSIEVTFGELKRILTKHFHIEPTASDFQLEYNTSDMDSDLVLTISFKEIEKTGD